MARISVAQRRARLARRHHLAGEARAKSITAATAALGALHATDPGTVYRSLWARVDDVQPGDVEYALYEERSLVRLKAMRGTLFVTSAGLFPTLVGAYGAAAARRERNRLLGTIDELGLTVDAEAWLGRVEGETLAAVVARGEALGRELSDDVPELKTKFTYGEGRKWASASGLTTWVLNLLAAEGRIVRARPAGSWGSGQYRWAPAPVWFGDGPATRQGPPTAEEARAEVVAAWLAAFGPGTVDDVTWWTGFPVTQVRKALVTLGAAEVELGDDRSSGVVLPDDLGPVEEPGPWIAVLPPLDPTALGWKHRDWYLSEEAKVRLFDRSGNIGPSIWCDGRVVGGWAQRRVGGNGAGRDAANGDGGPAPMGYELFEDIGHELTGRVEAELGRLGEWHGDVPVAARGRRACPLERDLTGAS